MVEVEEGRAMKCGDTGTRDTLDVDFELCSSVTLGAEIDDCSRVGKADAGVGSLLVLDGALWQRASAKISACVNSPRHQ